MNGTVQAAKIEVDDPQVLVRTGQISCYDGQGNLIGFSGSGQDGEYQRGKVWPVPRFVNNSDGTISDSLTGLMWLKDGSCLSQMSWHSASRKIDLLNKNSSVASCVDYGASHTDWRLPELDELASLVDAEESVVANFLKLSGFTEVQAKQYWTNTTYMNPLNAWYISMVDGTVAYQNKMEKNFLLPVRGALSTKGALIKKEVIEEEQPAEDLQIQNEMQEEMVLRFVDNGDGTISDTATGLMWMKDAGCIKERTWSDAIAAVEGLEENLPEMQCEGYNAAYADWTLPNKNELISIVDYRHDFPALEEQHPFINLLPSYWTSTTLPSAPEQAFTLSIYEGAVMGTSKMAKLAGWPVRQSVQHVMRPRETTRSGLGDEVNVKYVLKIDPELNNEIRWPPSPRFIDNGDGTSMDRVTGYTWLSDANCFGKLTWDEIFTELKKFNSEPRRYNCTGYEVAFGDWIVPAREDLEELVNKKEKNSATWLESQGVLNLQASGDYWSATPTLINLYYAYVLNFKKGTVRNYPKSLKFFFWPRRILSQDSGSEPLLNLTINAIGERVLLNPSEKFSVALYLHTFGMRQPADFWFWYETPDNQKIWLSPIRTWTTKMTPVFQGELFNLKNYEIIRGNTQDMEAGDYVFYFAVDFNQNGILDELRHQSRVIFSID